MNKKLLWFIGAGFLLVSFLCAIGGILLPFVLAFVLAYLLNPLVKKLSKIMGRNWATALVVLAVVWIVVCFLFLLIPVLQAQISNFIGRIPLMAEKLWSYLKSLILWGKPEISYQDMYRISDSATQTAIGVLSSFGAGLNRLISGGLAFVNILMLIFISPIVLFYVLKDLPFLAKKSEELIPKKYQTKTKELAKELDKTLSAYLRGQSSLCLILMVYYTVALSFVGLDLGAVIGMATGILSFIPYVGFFTGLLVSCVMALIQGGDWTLWAWLGGAFAVGSVLETYILTPYLVGRHVGLSPFWVLFALLAGGALFGLVGVLIAVPLAAVLGVLIRHLYAWYLTTKFYQGKE